MSSRNIYLTGKVSKLKEADAKRLSAYVLRGNDVIGKASLNGNGTFRVAVSREAVIAKSVYGVTLAVAPSSLGEHLAHLPNVTRIALNREGLEKAEGDYNVKEAINLSEEVLKVWWGWCGPYCVSGTVIGPNGCPVPGADVTVYTVNYSYGSYTKVPEATVSTGPDGSFTACFEWCHCYFCYPCWPCWPIWWECWPWWWEFDILHVINVIEQNPPIPGPGPVEQLGAGAALIRPDGRALMRGQGFTFARTESFVQDPTRTAFIKSKLSDARIRAIFPWWWWCCDDPNILFSVTQAGNTIVNENPAFDTRWCLEDGSSVVLVGNNQTIGQCNQGPPPETGFVWDSVGNISVQWIHQGYADGTAGADTSDLAFAGTLYIFGQVAPGTPMAYFQVSAGQWGGDPARGGTAPGFSQALSVPLYNYAVIYDASINPVFQGWIQMGPTSGGGSNNLYATEATRQSGVALPGLSAFPAIPAGGFVTWLYPNLKVATASTNLIEGNSTGAVDLTLAAFDAGFAPIALAVDDPLTLTIDNVPLNPATTAHINGVTAYDKNNNPVSLGTGSNFFCPAYDIGPGGYVKIDLTVDDPGLGHLWEYYLDAEWGHGASAIVTPPGVRGYVSNPYSTIAGDPNYTQKSWQGGTSEVMTYYPTVDCCYEFRIRAAKRLTDGYSYPTFADYDFQTINLKVSS